MTTIPETFTGIPKGVVRLDFKDGESITILDKKLIKNLPAIAIGLGNSVPNWEKDDAVFNISASVPFSKGAAMFLFTYIGTFVPPQGRTARSVVKIHYPQTVCKSLDELKEIMEVAAFCDCLRFIDCISFVISDRLKGHPPFVVLDDFGRPRGTVPVVPFLPTSYPFLFTS